MDATAPILFTELSGTGGKLGLITLNRPQALNALTHEMIVLMHQQLIIWEDDPHLKAVIVCAVEGRAFCAGGDLRLVHEKNRIRDLTLTHFFRDEYRLNRYIFHYPKPYIALLDGITMGGGAGISIHGSHRVGTERIVFAMPETGIGFFPDVGGTYFLSRLPHGLGFYLGLTGARLNCDDCLHVQLVDYKIRSTNLPLVVRALTETPLTEKPDEAVGHVLHQFHEAAEETILPAHYPFIEKYFVQHTIEAILAMLEKAPGIWYQETLNTLRKKSPTSLKITLRQLHEGLKRDFDQCMQLEYHLMGHFLQSHDFYEGIRAVLIDKTQDPHWQPTELSQVSEETVETFFTPLPGEPAQLLFS